MGIATIMARFGVTLVLVATGLAHAKADDKSKVALDALYAKAKASGKTQLVVIGAYPTMPQILDKFREDFPDITVSHNVANGAALLTRLEAERTSGNYAVDVVISGPYDVQSIERLNLLQPYIPKTADALPAHFKTKSGVFSMPFRNLFALMYNSTQIAEKDVPGSLEQLLDDKWSGKVGHAYPTGTNSFSTCAATLWYNKILSEDQLRKLHKIARVIQRSTDVSTFVAQGRMTFGIWGPTQTAYQLQKDGAPIRVKYLTNATVMFGAGMGLMKNPPHADAAKLFMEWMYSPNGQLGVTAMTATSTMPDAPVPSEYPKMPPYTVKDIPLDQTITVLESFRKLTKAIWN